MHGSQSRPWLGSGRLGEGYIAIVHHLRICD